MASSLDKIRKKFDEVPEAKLGFVVYRCTYEDDEAWAHFISFLTAQTLARIENSPFAGLGARLDWNIQEDKEKLDNASYETVRDEFRKWTKDGKEVSLGLPRHTACVAVDKYSVDSVRRWKGGIDEYDFHGFTWVYLISIRDEGPSLWEQGHMDEEEQAEQDKKTEAELEAEAEEETDNISKMRVGISYLFPRTFGLVQNHGWCRISHPFHVVTK
ncbi:hypothetical protein P154DRAFT_583338 [Amniculicola lignicola CBS 123094]|uniref:Uncharacterized protein n=1 Tax=Amniculicola lignicola CBS 123094 TaxID=1392246 RepID=A0A6A5VW58_9PLEO|nr:hypothetical protein P154DRAFT_583338 [Amniculicola lignicola CBS 123094]